MENRNWEKEIVSRAICIDKRLLNVAEGMAVNLNGVVKTDYRDRALIVDNSVNKDWKYSLWIFFSLFRSIYSSFIPFVPFLLVCWSSHRRRNFLFIEQQLSCPDSNVENVY